MTTYLPLHMGRPSKIDVAEITHIKAYKDQAMIMGKDGRICTEYYTIFDDLADGQALADFVAAAGRPLLPIQIRDPNNNYAIHNTEYVAAEAISFITASQVGEDGLQGVILNVRGGWRVETYVTPEELQEIVEAFKVAKPATLTFQPDEVYARWYRPEALYIDPSAITRMHSDNSQLFVQFHNTAGDLDIHVNNEGRHPQFKRGPELNAFAEKLFAATTGMIKLNGPRDFCAVQKDNIKIVDTDDIEPGSYSHTFFMRLIDKPGHLNTLPTAFNLYFKTAEDRAGAIAQLQPTEAVKRRPSRKQQP